MGKYFGMHPIYLLAHSLSSLNNHLKGMWKDFIHGSVGKLEKYMSAVRRLALNKT